MAASKKKHSSDLINDYHLLSFDSLDSTNEEAKRLAKGGGCHGAVIWAKKQTAGKGRMGRQWVSSEGNLFVSVLLQPEKSIQQNAELSFVAAVAVLEALEALVPEGKLECKWPNDILLDGKKLISFSLSGAPEHWVRDTGALQALMTLFDRHLCAMCGLQLVDHVHTGGIVDNMTQEAVDEVLASVGRAVDAHFGRLARRDSPGLRSLT